MSGRGAPARSVSRSAARVAVVAASWHDEVMDGLITGAQTILQQAGVADSPLFRVPGSFELPVVARACAESGFDAVVALGVVIRGGTPHFEYVAAAVTDGLGRVALDTGVPVGFGVLTCDTLAQARDRAGLPASTEDKGAEAAQAVLDTCAVLAAIA